MHWPARTLVWYLGVLGLADVEVLRSTGEIDSYGQQHTNDDGCPWFIASFFRSTIDPEVPGNCTA